MRLVLIRICRILLARLEYLRETFQIKEGDFLTFDALVCFRMNFWKINLLTLSLTAMIIVGHYSVPCCAETGCSMCGACHSFKSGLWNDDICWQKVACCQIYKFSTTCSCVMLKLCFTHTAILITEYNFCLKTIKSGGIYFQFISKFQAHDSWGIFNVNCPDYLMPRFSC